MRRFLTTVLLLLGVSAAMFAQAPVITAVLDAGGYTANLAPGIVFVVKGTNLCSASGYQASAVPYSTAAFGGVSITLTPVAGGTALNAYMIYTYNVSGVTQLAGELPSTAAAGDYNVTVTSNGSTSAPFKTTVTVHKFQLMTQSGSGSGRALAQNVVSQSEYDVNGYTTGPVTGTPYQRSPGKPTEILIAWGVGLGAALGFDASAPANGLDFIATQKLNVQAIVGGMQIGPGYAGRSNLFPGLDNIYFTLPANVPTGCNVTFQVSVSGQLSNLTTVSIAPNGGATACVDPQYDQNTLSRLDNGGTYTGGYFSLTSLSASFSAQGVTLNSTIEAASGSFIKYTADTITQLPSIGSASTGACQVYSTTAATGTGGTGGAVTAALDAGTITLNGPGVNNRTFTKTNNAYSLSLSTGFPPGPPVISAGTYTIAGAGGADVKAFNASITLSQPLTITGGLPSTVNRSQDLPIAWTGGGSSIVVIVGASSVLVSGTATNGTTTTGTFICTTTADKLSFTVPTAILQQLPATPANTTTGSGGILEVFTATTPATGNGLFTAPLTAGGNIDYGIFTAGFGTLSAPTYQ